MRRFSPFAFLTVALIALSCVDHAAAARPNVVVFFVDDFGYKDLSCYGSSLYETPHMDKLAAEGMRFTQAYSAYPRCVPSRQGFLSGKYPHRIEAAGAHPHHLPLSEVTFGEALQAEGYATCYIGKWHLGKEGGGPGDQGFETVIHSGSAGATGRYFFPFEVEKGLSVDNPVEGEEGQYLTDRLTDEAVDYIRQERDQPFLMVMAHYAVHTPIEAPDELVRKYRSKLRKAGIDVGGKKVDPDMVTDRQGITKTIQNNPTYAGMVEKTDDSLGRILAAIDDQGLGENTVVILTSDHGGLSTRGLDNRRQMATSNAPLRQGKGSIFEGGTRVPLIVRWPGKIQPGTVSDARVTGTDHYPTMLQLTSSPAKPEQHVDGVSYAAALAGKPHDRDAMYWYKWQARPDSTGDTRAISVIDGDFKLIRWLDEDLIELFHLKDDISETTNLAGDMPDRVESMLALLEKQEANAPKLRDKGLRNLKKRLERKNKKKKNK